ENAKMLEPGFSLMTTQKQEAVCEEVDDVLKKLQHSHGNGRWKDKLLIRDAIADIALQQARMHGTW
ncbi:hypothetical protein CBR_g88811, partial [Chara braunii]